MSLVYAAIREPGDELPISERVIYKSFVKHLEEPTSPPRAILRAARDCGVSRQRVLDIVRLVNQEVSP
jgi:hypothetical protein